MTPPTPFPGPDAVGLLAGFSYRPTSPQNVAEWFDGRQWTSGAGAVLPSEVLAPVVSFAHFRGSVRYMVDVRVVEPGSGRVLAVYY